MNSPPSSASLRFSPSLLRKEGEEEGIILCFVIKKEVINILSLV